MEQEKVSCLLGSDVCICTFFSKNICSDIDIEVFMVTYLLGYKCPT